MSPLEIAVQLSTLIGSDGVTTYASSLNGINLQDGDRAAIAIAITQALQEVFALGPTALSEQLYGDVLRPPANVTFNATQYSETISGFATWADWMQGCTIQGGDGEDNELISATQLVRPFTGSSGVVSGTVYADAIRLPDWVKNTMDPVWTPRVPQLRAATSREEFRFYNSPYSGDRAHHHATSQGAYYTSRNKTVGEPCVYFVEARYDPLTGALPLFMRFNPMPGSAMPITFRVKRKPPIITAADLAASSITISGTLTPDITGTLPLVGAGQGNAYSGGSPVTFLYYQGGWQLFCVDADGVSHGWYKASGGSTDPSGAYNPADGGAGIATVTASSGTNLVIPTDWHESILLPLAKLKFIAHPGFQNPSAAAQIAAQVAIAKATLESFIPQITPARGYYQ